MIKVNVELNNKLWIKKIKNPKKYFENKLKKITLNSLLFKKKKIIFTILLTNTTNIKKLNKSFRNKNKPTDVLSFPNYTSNQLKVIKGNNIYIGDIALCYEVIKNQSNKSSFYLEFDKAWVHGLLHLIGYDHMKKRDYKKMEKKEKIILKSIT
jgi:probable rRNA maturation factor